MKKPKKPKANQPPTADYSQNSFLERPTKASAGSTMPILPEEIAALIIITGAKVKWNWNFWIVTRRDGVRKHLHAGAIQFEQWRDALIDPQQ